MHAYLFVGNKLDEKIRELVNKQNGFMFEFPIQKIEDVRSLNDFLKTGKNENTFIVCRNVDDSSVEALNAFLKNLEEPQRNVTFILTAINENKVLPTIHSRCQIIRFGYQANELSNNALEFIESDIGQKFNIVDKIKTRPEAIKFTSNLVEVLHSRLLLNPKNNYKYLADNLQQAQKTLNHLEANGNVNLQLSLLAVNLISGQN